MSRKYALACCLSVSAFALFEPSLARAQNSTAAAPSNRPSASAADSALADIVVTARRRDEALQSVPLSITALSGNALEKRNVISTEQLRNFAPGVNISGQNRDQAQFYIRGQGPGQIFTGQNNFTSVATYFADVPTTIAGSGVFFDLASVQVLKGPQGTLFGRNTTGGAVLFEPAKPVSTWGGYIKGTYGNFNYHEIEGLLNIPIIPDGLEARVAGVTSRREGYTRSVITNQRLDSRNYDAFRISVLARPFDGLESTTIFDYRRSHNTGSSQELRQVNPNAQIAAPVAINPQLYPLLGINPATVDPNNPPSIPISAGGSVSAGCLQAALPGCPAGNPLFGPLGPVIAAFQQAYNNGNSTATGGGGFFVVAPTAILQQTLAQQLALGTRKTLIPELLFTRQLNWGVTNRTTWEISDAITIKNIIAFRREREAESIDFDGSPLNTLLEFLPTNQKWQIGQDQFTEEFQVQGKIGDSLRYILGYFHLSSKPGFRQEILSAALQPPTLRVPDNNDKSDAVFAHAEFNATSRLQFSGGFRYTWDKRSASVSFFDPTTLACNQVDPEQPVNGTGNPVFTCPLTYEKSFHAPTWDFTTQYKVTDSALVYAAYRRGYKSGGFNLPAPAPQFRTFNPEKVDDFEIGLKADWDIGVPLRTNIAGFYDKYKNIQIAIATVIPGSGVATIAQNVGRATNKGVEFETTIIPVHNFSLSGFVSYLRAASDVLVPGTPAIPGRQTSFQPKWKYGINASYVIPMPNDGDLTFTADYSWQSSVKTNDFASPIDSYPSYGIMNARIEWTNVFRKGLDLSIFGSNLTQEKYIEGGYALATQLGFEADLYGEPRTYGISAKIHFGEY